MVWAVTDSESGDGGGGVPSDSRRVRCVCCVVSVWCGRSQTVRAGRGGGGGGRASESRRVRCMCCVISAVFDNCFSVMCEDENIKTTF